MQRILRAIGSWALSEARTFGHMFVFLGNAFYYMFVPPFKFGIVLRQIWFLGNKSLLVIFLTGAFAGMVLSL